MCAIGQELMGRKDQVADRVYIILIMFRHCTASSRASHRVVSTRLSCSCAHMVVGGMLEATETPSTSELSARSQVVREQSQAKTRSGRSNLPNQG
jgi:hypothetical protein